MLRATSASRHLPYINTFNVDGTMYRLAYRQQRPAMKFGHKNNAISGYVHLVDTRRQSCAGGFTATAE